MSTKGQEIVNLDKTHKKFVNWLVILLDFILLVSSLPLVFTLLLRVHYFDRPAATAFDVSGQIEWLLFLCIPSWIILMQAGGMYKSFRTSSVRETNWLIIRSGLLSFLFLVGLVFLLNAHPLNRGLVCSYITAAIVLLILEKWVLRSVFQFYLRRGKNKRNILLVGTGPRAEHFVGTVVLKHPEWGIHVVGLIDEDEERVNKEFFGIKCIGVLSDIPRILDEQAIEEVVIVVPRMWLNRIQQTISDCELRGVKVSVAGDLFELRLAQAGQKEDMDGFPLLPFHSKVDRDLELFIKRCLDIAVSLGVLVIFSVPLLLVALLVKWTSPGPVLFRQKRVGLHGRLFAMHKFRTMYQDSKERFEKVVNLNEASGPVFKIKNDPRITPLGRFLRKFSIDEFPQFWDVLVGNMSLVGPRPGLAGELEDFEPWMLRRLTMRPGLTCYWQIMGRSNIDFRTWMELDLKYIDNWSLVEDIKILLRTIPAVIKAEGAS